MLPERQPQAALCDLEGRTPQTPPPRRSRASPGTSKARILARAARCRCWPQRRRSRTGWPTTGCPSEATTWRSTRCQPRGRTTSVARSEAEPVLACRPATRRPAAGGRRRSTFACPSAMFAHVGRVGVLEVGHEHPGAGVEGVDHHLGVSRPGDLDPPVGQVGRGGRDPPLPVADTWPTRVEIPAGPPCARSDCSWRRRSSNSSRRGPSSPCSSATRAVGGAV